MGEINLICPGCKAEYVLPDDALPVAGREVECSSCGLVWEARRSEAAGPLDLGSFTRPTPPPAPSASRRLAPEVLDILREEVEHERRLRNGEAPLSAEAAVPQPEGDWPATTVVVPTSATRAVRTGPKPPVPLTPAANASPAVIRHKPAAQPAPVPRAPERLRESGRDRSGGYVLGFGLMVMLAAACVAIYVLAPQVPDEGGIGERLVQIRDGLDRIRLWLDMQAARLTG
ncbi:MAG: zinc-ribbon domain-containing protein [Paracoccus sp. (in: a-proteobacteria)]|uniref:zinc-ribbon domain-containing protein n=1 Tax=Paracoccus sp. TaxID=267 RepID=UPI004059D295